MKYFLRFITTVTAGVAMTSSLFFALSYPARSTLDDAAYAVAQHSFPDVRIALFVEGITIALIALWMAAERQTFRRFYALLAAVILYAISVAVLVVFVLASENKTKDWNELSESWTAMRNQWEYAQLGRALLTLGGFSMIVVNLLIRRAKSSKTKYPTRQY